MFALIISFFQIVRSLRVLEAVYAGVPGFALKMPLKLSRY